MGHRAPLALLAEGLAPKQSSDPFSPVAPHPELSLSVLPLEVRQSAGLQGRASEEDIAP